ncbi:MAG: hypothetical protein QNJ46_18820 [Leptolyngbyaceae cyanobacterium MO_188.B28]|nr:hypothetical protein [Leptolyngbyaceae cyanobacterium MO_188.B28]
MLLCQIEMFTLSDLAQEPTYYIVGRFGFDPGLKEQEEVWVNWQVWDKVFNIKTRVIGRRKEVYVDGKSIVLSMSDNEKSKFSAIYPNGIDKLLDGASLFLLRILVEPKDRAELLEIEEAIAQGERTLKSQVELPKTTQ